MSNIELNIHEWIAYRHVWPAYKSPEYTDDEFVPASKYSGYSPQNPLGTAEYEALPESAKTEAYTNYLNAKEASDHHEEETYLHIKVFNKSNLDILSIRFTFIDSFFGKEYEIYSPRGCDRNSGDKFFLKIRNNECKPTGFKKCEILYEDLSTVIETSPDDTYPITSEYYKKYGYCEPREIQHFYMKNFGIHNVGLMYYSFMAFKYIKHKDVCPEFKNNLNQAITLFGIEAITIVLAWIIPFVELITLPLFAVYVWISIIGIRDIKEQRIHTIPFLRLFKFIK